MTDDADLQSASRKISTAITEGWFKRGLLFGLGFWLSAAVLAVAVFAYLLFRGAQSQADLMVDDAELQASVPPACYTNGRCPHLTPPK